MELEKIIKERITYYKEDMKKAEKEMENEMVGTNVKTGLRYELAKSLYEEDIAIISELEKILEMNKVEE